MQPTNTATTATTSNTAAPHTTGASAGSEVGSKIKGAFQTVHGIGEQIRGNMLDAADSATGDRATDSGHLGTTGVSVGAKNAALDQKGEREKQEGLTRMGAGPGSTL